MEPLTECRKCGQPIRRDQYRFGSPGSGWEHMEGECGTEPLTESRVELKVRNIIADVLSDRLARLDCRGPATHALIHVSGEIHQRLAAAGLLRVATDA